MDYSSWLVKQDGGETHQKTKMDILESESNTYLDDGSTSTDKGFLVSENNTCHVDVSTAYIMVADSRGSPAVKSNSDKGEPDSHGSQAVELISKDFKGGPYMDFLRFDGPTTKEAISLSRGSQAAILKGAISSAGKGQPDFHGAQAEILKEVISTDCKGQPDFHGAQAEILKEVISTDCKGEPYQRTDMDSESNTSCYDGLATEKAISLCTDIFSQAVKPMSGEDGHLVGGNVVVEAVIPMSGKGETFQITDVGSLDSESNTCHDDADSGSSQEGEVQGSSMESLPSDIVLDIVSRVPAESVLECKLVCRRLETLIRGSNFTDMHLSRQLNRLLDDDEEGNDNLAAGVEPSLVFACRINDHDVYRTLLFHGGQISERTSIGEKYIYYENLIRVYHPPMHTRRIFGHLVGSCNGLVCAYQLHHLVLDPIYICNPLTREYVCLPQLVVKREDIDPEILRIVGGEVDMQYKIASGFGYVRSTNEYKVVRIHYLGYAEGNVEVYTLGSGCGWRAINSVSYRMSTDFGGRGTYANDAIYWISLKNVVVFDLAAEEFRLLAPPSCVQNLLVGGISGLVALGRHLCLHVDVNESRMEIWSLVNGNDSNESWRMEFDIDYQAVVMGSRKRLFMPILLTKRGEIIFLLGRSVLYSYDTETTILRMISDEASTDYFETVEPIPHVNTLASLEAIGENSKRHTVRPRRARTPWDHVIDELDRDALGLEIETSRFRLK